MQVVFTKKEPPQWLLDMWKEIDDKTFGKGFDCFTEDAVCNLGVAQCLRRRQGRTRKQPDELPSPHWSSLRTKA
jgi:hypothetical protein